MSNRAVENMFKHTGKTVNIIGKIRVKTYRNLYAQLSDLQKNKEIPIHGDYLCDNDLSKNIITFIDGNKLQNEESVNKTIKEVNLKKKWESFGFKYIETNVFDDFRKKVKDYKPSVIMLSTVEPTHKFGIELLNKVRDLKIPTFVGGCFAIFAPELAIKDEVVDYVCVGEGEYANIEFCKVLATGKDTKKIKGVWAKDGNKIITP